MYVSVHTHVCTSALVYKEGHVSSVSTVGSVCAAEAAGVIRLEVHAVHVHTETCNPEKKQQEVSFHLHSLTRLHWPLYSLFLKDFYF